MFTYLPYKCNAIVSSDAICKHGSIQNGWHTFDGFGVKYVCMINTYSHLFLCNSRRIVHVRVKLRLVSPMHLLDCH